MGRSLHLEQLSVQYGAPPALAVDRMSFELESGSSMAILGPSGSGKSTLLHAIAGLLEGQPHVQTNGNVWLGVKNGDQHLSTPRFPSIALLPQDPRHVQSGFVSTVREECQLTLRQAGIPTIRWDPSVERLARALDIEHLLDRDPNTLSGGETQSSAFVAMAVAEPEVLLLDEPASALDQERSGRLTRFLLHRPQELSVILADTNMHPAVLACDHMLLLERGRCVFRGTREEFWTRLPEFQDLISVGDWLEVRRNYRDADARFFRAALEEVC